MRLWKVCRGPRAWHAPQKQPGTRETLKGPAALTARAKRVGEFNDKKNVPKPDRESGFDRIINAG